MKVEVFVQLRGRARKEIGKDRITLSLDREASIFELFETLEERLHWPFKERFIDPETGDLQRRVIVLVNGFPIRGKLKTILLERGDKVILFPHTVCG